MLGVRMVAIIVLAVLTLGAFLLTGLGVVGLDTGMMAVSALATLGLWLARNGTG